MSVFLTDAYREQEVKKKGAAQRHEDIRLVSLTVFLLFFIHFIKKVCNHLLCVSFLVLFTLTMSKQFWLKCYNIFYLDRIKQCTNCQFVCLLQANKQDKPYKLFQCLSTATHREREREREHFVMAYTVTVHASVPTDLTRTKIIPKCVSV